MDIPEKTPGRPDAPQPAPLRFYGTTWVDHSGGYALRRAGLTLAALVMAAAGVLVLRLAYEGLAIAEVGGLMSTLVVIAFVLCSGLAFARTITGFTRRDDDPTAGADSSLRSVKTIGFLGVLVAYALRGFVEAPGEKLLRSEYEEALARHERLRANRSGRPSAKRRRKR